MDYYEEQWVDGALCWRTSPTGAWTRYTANELAHRYESAEKRAADAQATAEALQAIIKRMGEQAAILAKDGMAAKAQVEALQRERDEWRSNAVAQEARANDLERDCKDLLSDIDGERAKVGDLLKKIAYWEKRHSTYRELAEENMNLKSDELSALQGLVRALPVRVTEVQVCQLAYGWRVLWEGGFSGDFHVEAHAKAYAKLLEYRATMDATTPDSNQLGAINDMVSKGGDGE